jgi:hypothetical protein
MLNILLALVSYELLSLHAKVVNVGSKINQFLIKM